MRFASTSELTAYRDTLQDKTDPDRVAVRICMTGCRAYGAKSIRDAFKEELKSQNLAGKVDIVETGCHGFCAKAPVCVIEPMGIFYSGLKPTAIPEVVEETIKNGNIVEDYVFEDDYPLMSSPRQIVF